MAENNPENSDEFSVPRKSDDFQGKEIEMSKQERIERLRNTIDELKDKKLTIEVAIFGLESQIILEELKVK